MTYRLIFCLLLIVAMVGVVSADTLLVYMSTAASDDMIGQNCPDFVYCTAAKSYTLIRGYGGSYNSGGGSNGDAMFLHQSSSGLFDNFERYAMSFNTSAIGSGSTVDSAKIGIYVFNIKRQSGDPDIGITGFTPATNYSIVVGDYDSFASTDLVTDINIGSLTTAKYNNFTFNAAGLAYISKTDATNLMARDSWDISGTFGGNTTVGYTGFQTRYQEYHQYGVYDPFLEITYTTGGGAVAPVASFTCTKNFLRIPNSVTCTDSSTNTPTSWSWNMGDGSAAKTTQNVTYPYMKRGIWGITLNATNAVGSNVTPSASNVRVTGYENNW
jgi:PKD repeat protein